MNCPEPGIYPNVPEAEYHAWEAVNSSRLKWMDPVDGCPIKSTLPVEQTGDMQTGSAAHRKIQDVLQGVNAFSDHYVVAEKCSATTKDSKRCSRNGVAIVDGKFYCKQHIPRGAVIQSSPEILTPSQWRQVEGVTNTICRHELGADVRKILRDVRPEDVEVSFVWRDPLTGLLCKGRADFINRVLKLIGDFKFVADASYHGFQSACMQRGYIEQSAHYLAGLAAAPGGVSLERAVYVSVEKSAPHVPSVNPADQRALIKAEERRKVWLSEFKKHSEAGSFPGYPTNFKEIDYANWKKREMEAA